MSFFSSTDSNRESNSWFLSGILSRSRSKDLSSSEEGRGAEATIEGVVLGREGVALVIEGGALGREGVALGREGVALGRDAILELVNRLGEEVEVEEDVETVMVVLVTILGAAKGRDVVVIEVDKVAFSEVIVGSEVAVDSSSKILVGPGELALIVVGFDFAGDKSAFS